jgi:ubiquinone/menaquinone biosynthesis C-methylase UbiE
MLGPPPAQLSGTVFAFTDCEVILSYFDTIAATYDAVRGEEIWPQLQATVDGAARVGDRIVDVATGTGLFSVRLAQAGYRVVGVDANPSMLRKARDKARRAGAPFTPLNGHAERLPLASASARLMLSTNAIHHFDLRQHFCEVQRLLQPGGRYVIFTRFREQNDRSLWGQLFPGFASKENRLLHPADFERMDTEFKYLTLENVDQLSFRKPFRRERLLRMAQQRKYSTFDLYGKSEFQRALAIFEKRLDSWRQVDYVAEIGQVVFRRQ